jgi:hypothetical protein
LGWQTPVVQDSKQSGLAPSGTGNSLKLSFEVQRASWPTPTTPSGGQTPPEGTSATGITPDGKKVQVTLKDVAAITSWPTPQMRDFRSGGEDRVENPDRSNNLNDFVLMAGWPTPMATDATKACNRFREDHQNGLGAVASITGWPTPAQTDHKGGYQGGRMRDGKLSTDRLDVTAQLAQPARLTASGEMLIGSSAEMESGGQLAPSHSRWLMGLPRAWDECAIAALKVSRKK